jgi:hypothetical protein
MLAGREKIVDEMVIIIYRAFDAIRGLADIDITAHVSFLQREYRFNPIGPRPIDTARPGQVHRSYYQNVG